MKFTYPGQHPNIPHLSDYSLLVMEGKWPLPVEKLAVNASVPLIETLYNVLTAADLPTCTHCEGICSDKDPHQACSLNPAFGSLGTTHCGSVVGRYLDGSGNVKDLAYRGCFDCASKSVIATFNFILIGQTFLWATIYSATFWLLITDHFRNIKNQHDRESWTDTNKQNQ